jgi:hypothetical protein
MSAISKQALAVDNNQSFPNNNAGAITPSALRSFNTNMIDSNVNQTQYNTDSGSWNQSISNLNTFTASQQPSFTALNSFTASQLVINTGVNSFTQSATGRLNNLESTTSSLNTFSASINQIQSNGVLLGTSVRFNLVGSGTFFSASLTPNVNGQIATLTFTSDNGKTNTSSFNEYTTSTAASQSVYSASVATSFSSSTFTFNRYSSSINAYTASQNSFNASATASISELLSLSSSLSGGYATQGELDASSSTLQANIDTKLNTSSFNSYSASMNTYTASINTKWTTIGLLTGSYSTTGSNVFTGSQTITGSVLGNVNALTITSNTASMNLANGNFFTLTLVSGSTTQLAASNIKAGQTINLLVTQASVGTGNLSYNSTFKFTPGNQYTASVSSSYQDILTFITFDNSTIYASAIKNLS